MLQENRFILRKKLAEIWNCNTGGYDKVDEKRKNLSDWLEVSVRQQLKYVKNNNYSIARVLPQGHIHGRMKAKLFQLKKIFASNRLNFALPGRKTHV